ncbi:MAG: ABC transporter ATP-binding protein [Candidatus Hadarchaeum sp.]|uniref:ABC transporter ATP-binding protein n=1 Tax=Candidatus Hadarchaeum sp. TaxID=2883567 RepID=UPI0031708201
MTQADVKLSGVTKVFGKVVAVNQVTLDVEKAEFFALLGPSGCGKTTTLRLIAGLERPTKGRIFIAGRDVTDLPPQERDAGMVFQDYALYPHMTLFENIAYPLKVRKVHKKQITTKVHEVAKHLMISDLLHRLPSQVSGGQQQRAAVARALVHAPKVFLFDEPLSNLDAKLRLEARAFLKHLQREIGVTALYVTHDQAEAMAMADRIGVMFEGKIIQVGPPLELYRFPHTLEVAAFLGNPPMNILPGKLCRRPEGCEFIGTGFSLLFGNLALEEGNVYLGFRPEHANVSTIPHPFAIPAKLYAIQPLGSEFLLTLEVGTHTVSVRVFAEDEPKFAEQVWLSLDMHKVYFFNEGGTCVFPR